MYSAVLLCEHQNWSKVLWTFAQLILKVGDPFGTVIYKFKSQKVCLIYQNRSLKLGCQSRPVEYLTKLSRDQIRWSWTNWSSTNDMSVTSDQLHKNYVASSNRPLYAIKTCSFKDKTFRVFMHEVLNRGTKHSTVTRRKGTETDVRQVSIIQAQVYTFIKARIAPNDSLYSWIILPMNRIHSFQADFSFDSHKLQLQYI